MENLPLPSELSLLKVLQRLDVDITKENVQNFLSYQIPMHVRLSNEYLIFNEEIDNPDLVDDQFNYWCLTHARFYKSIELQIARCSVVGSWEKKDWRIGFEPVNEPALNVILYKKGENKVCMALTPQRKKVIDDKDSVESWLYNRPYYKEDELAPADNGIIHRLSEIYIYKNDLEKFEQVNGIRDHGINLSKSAKNELHTKEENSFLSFIKSLADCNGIDLSKLDAKQIAVSRDEGKDFSISENTVRKILKKLQDN